jgi:hypothetical protein
MKLKCLSKPLVVGFIVGAVAATTATAQGVKTPSGPPGGLPGAAMPMPSLPSAPAPSMTVPPAPETRALVPPPPPSPAQSPRDAGGSEGCDCYRVIDGKRVLSGKNVACCPK